MGRLPKYQQEGGLTKDVRVSFTEKDHKRVVDAMKETNTNTTDMGRDLFKVVVDDYEIFGVLPQQSLENIKRASKSGALVGTLVTMRGYIGLSSDFDVRSEFGVYVQVPSFIRIPNDNCYTLIGVGESMTSGIGRSIPSGSHCLFCPSPAPAVGDIVHLEWANGEKCSLKEYRGTDAKSGEQIFRPLNPDHEELRFQDGDVEVKGVLLNSWIPRQV